MYGIIYKATNKINNKIYIGQTIKTLEERIYHHVYRANHSLDITHTHFINAIRKYGEENFIWEVIDKGENQEELNEKEIYWIKYYNSVNNGYNIQDGGNKYDSDKFALACGSKPFLAYRVNGEFLGEFINRHTFGKQYNIADTNVGNLIKNKYNSCNGIICIDKEEFTEQLLKEKLEKAKQTFRPFVAINLKTKEEFGPFETMKECREQLGLKHNHIGEILKGIRKSQEGYTFKFIDNI